MMHGRKKVEKKPLTEEEQKKKQDQLDLILKVNKALLEKKQAKLYDEEHLNFTVKAAQLNPDFYTIWNYRKEIFEHIFTTLPDKEILEKLGKELEFLVSLIKMSPKSYTLWYHRQWCILKGIDIEKKLGVKDVILKGEEFLCGKLLDLDERNFHCWNYKLWLLETEVEHFLKSDPALESAKYKKEIEFSTQKINKNFSNFSAWHYKSKVMKKLYAMPDAREEPYGIPLKIVKSELEILKQAFYTEPKEHSCWLYQKWLLNQITPVQATKVSAKKSEDNALTSIRINFSSLIKNINETSITVRKDGQKIEIKEVRSINTNSTNYAKTYEVVLNNPLALHEGDTILLDVTQNSESNVESIDGLTLLRNLYLIINYQGKEFKLTPNSEKFPHSEQQQAIVDTALKLIKQQIQIVEELLEVEEGLKYARYMLAELQNEYRLLSNNYLYAPQGDSKFDTTVLQNLQQNLKELITQDSKHKVIYEEKLQAIVSNS